MPKRHIPPVATSYQQPWSLLCGSLSKPKDRSFARKQLATRKHIPRDTLTSGKLFAVKRGGFGSKWMP